MGIGDYSLRTVLGSVTFCAGLLLAPAVQAADTNETQGKRSEAANFVLETGRKAISILKDDPKSRFELKQLFRNSFDYELMGRYALGRYWEKTGPDQRSEYRDLFAEYVPNGYMGQLLEYRDAEFVLVKSRTLDDIDTIVTTRLAPKTGDVRLFDWRVRTEQQINKVIDVTVGGVSYLTTLREQFTAIAARRGIDGLIDLLRKHAQANTAKTGSYFHSLASKIRETAAIDVPAKLDLKRKVDALVADFGRHHGGTRQHDLARLKLRFDNLFHDTVSLLQSGDPSLAAEVEALRPALWRTLSDPKQFVVAATH